VSADVRAALAGLSSDPAVLAALEKYVVLFLERNAAMNLSAARDPSALAEHVRDSLGIARYVREPLVDVGSGGGFPAIPIVIATGIRATLIESAAKKARFLREVASDLDLPIEVRAVRAEDAARDPGLRGTFASATARAVSSTPAVLELTVPFLEVGGIAVLQRGRLDDAERTAANDAALVLGAEIDEEIVADGGDDRRVLLVRKVAPTGPRFPRRAGVPAKRPLCYEVEHDA
jgi:16S rRNA (guanine527-N7)-methyltransferase